MEFIKYIDSTSKKMQNVAKCIGCEVMSTVLAVCGNNYVKMISDGRVIRFDSEKPVVVGNENYNKLRRINNDVILGFAGDKTVCEKAIKRLKSVIPTFPSDTIKLTEVAMLVQQILQESELGFLKVQFIIGGRNRQGEFGLYVMNSSTGFHLEKYFPKYGEHQIKVALPFCTKDVANNLIQKHFNTETAQSLKSLDIAMEKFVDDIADLDTTVNKNHFAIEILKGQ